MTAIGLFGMIICMLLFHVTDFGSRSEDVAGWLFIGSGALFSAGVFTWMWRAMP